MKEILIEVREVIKDRKSWTYNAWARDKYGKPVRVDSENAVRFCLLGAGEKVTGNLGLLTDWYDLLLELCKYTDNNPGEFNDTHTHKQVIEMLDRAIELAE